MHATAISKDSCPCPNTQTMFGPDTLIKATAEGQRLQFGRQIDTLQSLIEALTCGWLKDSSKNSRTYSSSIVTIILQKFLHHYNPRVFHCQHVLQGINHVSSQQISSSWLDPNGIKAQFARVMIPEIYWDSTSSPSQSSTMLRVPNVRVCKPFGKLLRDDECNGVGIMHLIHLIFGLEWDL